MPILSMTFSNGRTVDMPCASVDFQKDLILVRSKRGTVVAYPFGPGNTVRAVLKDDAGEVMAEYPGGKPGIDPTVPVQPSPVTEPKPPEEPVIPVPDPIQPKAKKVRKTSKKKTGKT